MMIMIFENLTIQIPEKSDVYQHKKKQFVRVNCEQWRREQVKAGEGDRSKWEKGRKCLLHRMSITLFGQFSIFCPKFSSEVPTEDLFLLFILVFQEDFPVTFAPK
jgi:hypothetical protein